MPIVFVHGVNVRRDATYQRNIDQRNAFLRQYALTGFVEEPSHVEIFNPYWGDLAAKLAWNHASLPEYGQEAFGAEDELLETALSDQAIAMTADAQGALLKMAHVSLPEAVDLLLLQTLQTTDGEQVSALVPLAHKLYLYAESHPQPEWLSAVQTDQAFLNRLRLEVERWQPLSQPSAETAEVVYESFGETGSSAWNAVAWGAMHLQQSLSRMSGQVVSVGRTPIHKAVSIFLGDAFKYLQMRGDKSNPGPIVQTVVADLDAAIAAKSTEDPYLIVIAHSMGGNICYDIFSHFRPDIQVDAFVTVGSQVSLLEELKLFHRQLPNVPGTGGDRMPKPNNIAHWLNVYNTNDVLSFACERVFADVVDFEYPAGSLFGIGAAHGLYFQRVSFYERFAYRLRRVLR